MDAAVPDPALLLPHARSRVGDGGPRSLGVTVVATRARGRPTATYAQAYSFVRWHPPLPVTAGREVGGSQRSRCSSRKKRSGSDRFRSVEGPATPRQRRPNG